MAGEAIRYFEIALGAVTKRNVFIRTDELAGRVAAAGEHELYRSFYMYGPEILEWTKGGRTIKGYQGTYALDTLIFDIDKGKETDEATLARARQLVTELSNEWLDEELIWPFFSGRGFHITTPDFFGFEQDTHELPATVAKTIATHFPSVDAIYDGGRIIRVAHTRNHKSGKYKIPLTVEELFKLDAEGILEMAKAKRSLPIEKSVPRTLHTAKIVKPPAKGVLVTSSAESEGENGERLIGSKQKASSDPLAIVPCAQKMYAEGDSTSYRHVRVQRIASVWRRAGVPESATVDALCGQFKTLDREEIVRSVQGVYVTPYEWGCHDEHMVKYCDSKCKFFKNKNYAMEIANAKDMEARFRDSVRSGFGGAVLDINDVYNIGHSFKIYPGEYITVMGDTGLGKTAFIQNLMIRWKLPSLLFSLENSEALMYRRFVQIQHGMSKDEVFEYYKYNDNHLSNDLSHIRIVTVKPLIQSIKELLPTSGAKLIVVDTIDCIEVPYKNDMEKLRVIPTELSFLAQQYGLIVVGVSHISKMASRSGAMDVHSMAGPATIEQRSDKVISVEGDKAQTYRVIKSQKARDEKPFQLAAVYDYNTFRYEQVSFG